MANHANSGKNGWAMRLAAFDEAFPTIVRYTGLVLTLILVGFSLAGYYVQAAPGFVAAAGMILYKTVRDAARENGRDR